MSAKTKDAYTVIVGDWQRCAKDAGLIRHEVFVDEQRVPAEEELDDQDAVCVHAVAYDSDGMPVGTGRLLPHGHIGRMAVRRVQRGKGIGSLLLRRLVDEARQRGHRYVMLAAQLHAQQFYAAHGFVAEGPVFLDAGIDHINMRLMLSEN